ncbi:MAG TPA: VWA domain-containing protein [Anaeromyxobacteraceae bacterium]|nr:VWA domain-containing protein [Anaeromyxobacteraceae bacterium]
MTSDLVAHLARFGAALRAAGVRVAVGDEEDALRAMLRVDLGDRAEVREALRCTLKIRPRDAEAFEALLDELWGGALRRPPRPPRPAAEAGPRNPGVPAAWSALGLAPAADGGQETEGDEPGWSRQALLRRKPFERCDGRDLAEMERLLARLAARLATRRSRRLAPSPRGAADLRRSLRRSFSTGGELLALARRARPVETPRLVLLLDTSGSMDAHARFLLAFARALKRVAPRTEVFAFNTELVRVTAWLSAGQQERVVARLAEAVPDWSGGTRLGECLAEFAERHLPALVDRRTVVVVLSDGLDRGDPALLGEAMRRIHARAGRVLWLNPLLGDPRYQPTARGMAAALPHVDRLEPAHDLASLERLLPHLAS